MKQVKNKPIEIITAVKQAIAEHRNQNECFSASVAESIAQRVIQLLNDSESSSKEVLLG